MQKYMTRISRIIVTHKSYAVIFDETTLTKSFKDACSQPQWAKAIDLE